MGKQPEVGHGSGHNKLMVQNDKAWTIVPGFALQKPYLKRQAEPVIVTIAALLFANLLFTPAKADVSVFDRGQVSRMAAPALQLIQAQTNNRAREQAIIGRLEEEIRRLNGRIEELEFEQRQTNNRLDDLAQRLEQRAVLSGASDQSGSSPTLVDQTARSPEDALRELTEQSGDGSLGSVPESAVANLPRPDPTAIAPPEKGTFSAEKQYENAVQLLRAGDYQGAQNGLETFLDIHEEHQLASNAAYWLAETHYVRQNYTASAAAFARNYGDYGKDAPKAIDNLLKLGMSLANLGQMEQACLTYDELNGAFPNTPAHIGQAVNRERARASCG